MTVEEVGKKLYEYIKKTQQNRNTELYSKILRVLSGGHHCDLRAMKILTDAWDNNMPIEITHQEGKHIFVTRIGVRELTELIARQITEDAMKEGMAVIEEGILHNVTKIIEGEKENE